MPIGRPSTTWPADLDELERRCSTRSPRSSRRSSAGDARSAPLAPGSSLTGRRARPRSSTPSSPAATSTTPPAGCAPQGDGFYTIGSAGHEANALVAAALRPDRPGAAALPLGRLLPRPGPAGARATTASRDVAARAARRRPTSRSPAAGTRCSATPTWRSSRRRRRSPRTCRGRSAWRSPSAAPAASALPTRWPDRRHRRVQLRRRLAQPLDGAGRAQRRGVHRAPAACRCRCCSCARTTGWGISVPTPAGWVAGVAVAAARRCAYVRADGTDPVGVFDAAEELAEHVRDDRPAGGPAPAHRALRRARRHRRRVGVPRPRPASAPTAPATRSLATAAGCSSPPAWRRRTSSSSGTSTAARRGAGARPPS